MLPYLNAEKENSKKYVVNFQGINLGEGYAEGEFSHTENITCAMSPSLSVRFGRELEAEYAAPKALHVKDGLLIVDGTNVIYKGRTVGTVDGRRKQIATIGNYVVIFPDKVYYNVVTGEFGSMEERFTAAAGKAVFTDDSITVAGAAFKFRVGDGVNITGCTKFPENNQLIIVRGVEGDTLKFYSDSFTAGTETASVSISRDVPDLDYICESNYRLWGTKGNLIYSSKYMDPLNFNSMDGSSGDSYTIEVATDGEFTGCIPYSSHICFFKENVLHKLFGSKPANFQLVTSQVYGVQAGSERSMCIINETLIYKGVGGVYAYSGGVPELISAKFGLARFSNACATSDGERYYISMRQGDAWHLMVYDVMRGIWLREDGCECVDMGFHEGHVYLLRRNGELLRVDNSLPVDDVEWSATFCPFSETVNERKGYSKFHLRLELGAKSWLTLEVKRDYDTVWHKVYSTHNEKARTVTVPILPARCDSVEIRLRGKGECKVRTFIREFFTGSDV